MDVPLRCMCTLSTLSHCVHDKFDCFACRWCAKATCNCHSCCIVDCLWIYSFLLHLWSCLCCCVLYTDAGALEQKVTTGDLPVVKNWFDTHISCLVMLVICMWSGLWFLLKLSRHTPHQHSSDVQACLCMHCISAFGKLTRVVLFSVITEKWSWQVQDWTW